MQTSAGFISSSSDWFLCSTGMIGCETTISNENYKTLFSNGNSPYFCRIRQAMQYGKTIDDYTSILLKNNEGDYPCSWLLGNINTGEIALFEIMQKQYSLQKTNNGVFYGMNSIIDPVIRTNETTDQHFLDLATSSGARNVRLNHLLNEVYYGKINMSNSKNILSDHYDSFLGKECLGGRCICKHGELNDDSRAGKVYSMHGCTDGKVVNTNLAKKLSFWGRIGSSCGRVFHPKDFLKKHPDKKYPKELQQTIVKQPWVLLDFDRKLIKNTTHIK
jgi:hypothetical protein